MNSYKNKLYFFEEEPPKEIWASIEQELHGAKEISLQQPEKGLSFRFYATAVAASLLVIFTVGLFFNQKQDKRRTGIREAYFQAAGDSAKNNFLLNQIIESKSSLASMGSSSKKYITIAGPNGEPVKISPKAATLILRADNTYPPKAVWKDTIGKWQQMMLTNTELPTSAAGLLEIIQESLQTE